MRKEKELLLDKTGVAGTRFESRQARLRRALGSIARPDLEGPWGVLQPWMWLDHRDSSEAPLTSPDLEG